MLAARNAKALDEVAAEIRATDSRIETLVVPTDISDEIAVDFLFEKIVEKFGGADVLINNSGIQNRPALIRDADPKLWWDVFVSL